MGGPCSFPLHRRRNAHELSRSSGLGCSLFARRYSGNRGCFLFLGVLRWFTSPRWPPVPYGFRDGFPDMTPGWLPHSEIPGSTPACGSPGLIAACHVLHRLPAPRHPPCALSSLTLQSYSQRMLSFLPQLSLRDVKDPAARAPDVRLPHSLQHTPCREHASRDPMKRTSRPPSGGGEYRARTGDLLVANQALSQLS